MVAFAKANLASIQPPTDPQFTSALTSANSCGFPAGLASPKANSHHLPNGNAAPQAEGHTTEASAASQESRTITQWFPTRPLPIEPRIAKASIHAWSGFQNFRS
jgi:hypothetical protein